MLQTAIGVSCDVSFGHLKDITHVPGSLMAGFVYTSTVFVYVVLMAYMVHYVMVCAVDTRRRLRCLQLLDQMIAMSSLNHHHSHIGSAAGGSGGRPSTDSAGGGGGGSAAGPFGDYVPPTPGLSPMPIPGGAGSSAKSMGRRWASRRRRSSSAASSLGSDEDAPPPSPNSLVPMDADAAAMEELDAMWTDPTLASGSGGSTTSVEGADAGRTLHAYALFSDWEAASIRAQSRANLRLSRMERSAVAAAGLLAAAGHGHGQMDVRGHRQRRSRASYPPPPHATPIQPRAPPSRAHSQECAGGKRPRGRSTATTTLTLRRPKLGERAAGCLGCGT